MQIETLVLVAITVALVAVIRRLRMVEAGINELLRMQGVGAGGAEPSEEVRALASAGDQVEAMRAYRRQSGADVRQARKVVDQLAGRQL